MVNQHNCLWLRSGNHHIPDQSHGFPSHGGPVPTEVKIHSFLNTDDVIINDGIHETIFRKSGSVLDGKPPLFPDLSPYTGSVFHTREGSDDLYLTVVWMFTDKDLFLDNQGVLTTFYLERYGRLSTTSLTLEYPDKSSWLVPSTSIIHATGFENNITAGYFTTIQYDDSTTPAYYIVYYGAIKSGNLIQQTPYLKELMKPVFDPTNFNNPTFSVGYSS